LARRRSDIVKKSLLLLSRSQAASITEPSFAAARARLVGLVMGGLIVRPHAPINHRRDVDGDLLAGRHRAADHLVPCPLCQFVDAKGIFPHGDPGLKRPSLCSRFTQQKSPIFSAL
jgi:hypothetical protein